MPPCRTRTRTSGWVEDCSVPEQEVGRYLEPAERRLRREFRKSNQPEPPDKPLSDGWRLRPHPPGSNRSPSLCSQVLLFPANRFSALSWTSFQIFSNIYEIDLTANEVPRPLYPPHQNIDGALTQSDASVVLQVPEVPPSPAAVLPRLSVLRLGSNRLTGLAGGSFTACPALIELYLENNSIAALSDHAFSGLDKLEVSGSSGPTFTRWIQSFHLSG